MNSRETLHCQADECPNTYGIEDSDANDPTKFCSRDGEEWAEELVVEEFDINVEDL